jgi:hypothetical protein
VFDNLLGLMDIETFKTGRFFGKYVRHSGGSGLMLYCAENVRHVGERPVVCEK